MSVEIASTRPILETIQEENEINGKKTKMKDLIRQAYFTPVA
jgi:hypothetical protein